ncbi:MAG: hypothetical protein IRZ14_06335, partial [Chloroflexi bacterium]|nr:hypothetical protein [Chloroflexota bacterium]
AWQAITATLLDPAALAEGLAAAQALYAAEHRQREERLATLDREIAQRRARLGRLLDEQLDAPAGSETARLLTEKARQLDAQLQHLQAQREQLSQAPHTGLAPAEIAALEEFAADVRAGLAAATVAEQRRIVELLDLRAMVACDERGLRLGKRHHFRVEWTAVLPLREVPCTASEFVTVHPVAFTTVREVLIFLGSRPPRSAAGQQNPSVWLPVWLPPSRSRHHSRSRVARERPVERCGWESLQGLSRKLRSQ